jgi:hypothetical protein
MNINYSDFEYEKSPDIVNMYKNYYDFEKAKDKKLLEV